MVRRSTASLLLLALALALVGGGGVAAGVVFADNAGRFSFTVPDGWEMTPPGDENIVVQCFDPGTGGSFGVLAIDAPSGATLEQIVSASIREFAKRDEYQADSDGAKNSTVGGVRAKSFMYSSRNRSGTPVVTRVWFVINDGTLYTLNFAATPDAADAFAPATTIVLDSWEFA